MSEQNSFDTEPEIQEFKGNPLICLNPNSKYPLSFGLTKARLIVKNIDQIIAFVDSDGESLTNNGINKETEINEDLPI